MPTQFREVDQEEEEEEQEEEEEEEEEEEVVRKGSASDHRRSGKRNTSTSLCWSNCLVCPTRQFPHLVLDLQSGHYNRS